METTGTLSEIRKTRDGKVKVTFDVVGVPEVEDIRELMLKRLAQEHFERNNGTREDFIRIFGRSYL